MQEKILFEITRKNLDTGLRGVPVGYCVTSSVDPHKGLFYAGLPISEVGHWEPMPAIYLLYYGEKGSSDQVAKFEKEISKRAHCKQDTLHSIEQLPRSGHPMDLFVAALTLAGIHEGTQNYREDCLNIIARLPQLVAAVINHHAGWGKTPASKPELGYMENFTQMLQGPKMHNAELMQVFKLFNVVHYDHDGGNLSTFVGKAVASGLEHMYGSLSASMAALAGPRHGRANQDCLAFVEEVLKAVGEQATEKDVEQFIRDRLAKKKLIFGFGHAVLRVEDPRATVFYEYSKKHFAQNPLIKIALALRTAGPKVLSQDPKISNPYPNIDAITGSVLMAAGFPYPDYYTLLFGLSRCVGIAIQILYERMVAREGKGLPIMRPNYLYTSREHASAISPP